MSEVAIKARLAEQALANLERLRNEGRIDTTTLCWLYVEQSAYRRDGGLCQARLENEA